MVTQIDNRSIFSTEYGERTAGVLPRFSEAQPVEKSGLSAIDKKGQDSSEDVSFLDIIKNVIDIANPFQHIPVVSTIYQKATGDEMNDAAKLAGDTVYGGVIGGVASLAGIVYENFFQGGIFGSSTSQTAAAESYKAAEKMAEPRMASQFSSYE